MVRSNLGSGVGLLPRCESVESRQFFSSSTPSTAGLDTGFGDGGLVVTRFGTGGGEVASAGAVLKDGRLLVAGTAVRQGVVGGVLLAAYGKDGSLSRSFDRDGKLVLPQAVAAKLGGAVDAVFATPDGGALVSGPTFLVKIKSGGQIDTAYGRGGYAERLATTRHTALRASAQLLSDGTYEEVGIDTTGRLYLRDTNARGKAVTAIQRPLRLRDAGVDLRGRAITVVEGTRVYRFKTSGLQKISYFGTGGVLDLTASLNAFADKNGPFTDGGYGPELPHPTVARPPFAVSATTYATKAGFGLTGRTGYASDRLPSETTSGSEASRYTLLYFSVGDDGKKVTVGAGQPTGPTLARPSSRLLPGDVFSGENFGVAFGTPAGPVKMLESLPQGTTGPTQAEAVVFLSDGRAYVIGEQEGTGADAAAAFVVVRTRPVA